MAPIQAAGPGRADQKRPGAALLALGLVLLATLWGRAACLTFPFFADDYLFLDQVRNHSLVGALTSPDPLRNYWRPVSRQAYFWFVSRLGESPLLAHAVNVLAFLGVIVLLFVLTRRLAGTRAAVIAASVVGLHEVADVPVLWASGSQDVLAVTGALGALCLAAAGRTGWAALPFACGLLSKETVAVTPLVALLLCRGKDERWFESLRRVLPMFGVLLVWAPIWLGVMSGGVRDGLAFGIGSVPAAMLHLVQAFFGWQWGQGAHLSLAERLAFAAPIAVALAGVALAVDERREPGPGAPRAVPPVTMGLVWALAATIPVAPVVRIWCSYYYLFAVCGLALAAGAALRRAPLGVALAVVLLIGGGSEHARRLESFATAPGEWGAQSHLTRFYFERSLRWVARYLEDLRRQRPTLPRSSTLFFAGTPAFASWQSADGPLVRWAYRDSSLRSYYFSEFTLQRARRGEVLVFVARNDSLVEYPDQLAGLQALASGQMLSERHQTAHDALSFALETSPTDRPTRYWRAWLSLALGDTVGHLRDLEAAGFTLHPASETDREPARRALLEGDTARAAAALASALERHAHDAWSHGQLAGLYLRFHPGSSAAAVEALAARLLAPDSPDHWRTWARIQLAGNHAAEAFVSLDHALSLVPRAERDPRDVELLEVLRRALPGGDLARKGLLERPRTR